MSDQNVQTIGPVETAWEPQIQTLSADPVSVKLVAQGSIAFRGGRGFTMFKRPGQAVNTLHEIHWGPPIALEIIGTTPIPDYKDGACDLGFDQDTLVVFNTCSPNPATGGDAVAVLWRTDIVIPGDDTGSETALANRLAALESHLVQHEGRLDWTAYQAGVAGNALLQAAAALQQAAAALVEMANRVRG